MSCWTRTGDSDGRHGGCWRWNAAECMEGGEEEDEPIPNALTPAPQPPVIVGRMDSCKGGEVEASWLPPAEVVAKRATPVAPSFSATPGAKWTSLYQHLQQRSLVMQICLLDLSTVEVNDTQWGCFCRDVLPEMLSLSSLKLARMGMTDKRLAVLLHGCCVCRRTRTSCGRPRGVTATSRFSIASAAAWEASPSSASGFPGSGTNAKTGVATLRSTVERSALRRLSVLDLSWNHLTYRSAAPLGKFFLWAADTLDAVILLGNPLQDYGFQILGIYLSKLQMVSLRRESHLFPPSLVQQHLDVVEREKGVSHDSRLEDVVRRGSSLAAMGLNTGDTKRAASGDLAAAQLHLGISFLDLRNCQSTARGISELLAGASRAHRLSTLLLANNGVIPSSVASPKPPSADEWPYGSAGASTDSRDDSPAEANTSVTVCKFSSFGELHYPCMLTVVDLCGVPLSRLCSPIGCRELFLNLLFCCPKLHLLDVSESFDHQQLPPSLLLQLLLEGQPSNPSVGGWRLEREMEGESEFTLDTILIGGQACVGGIFCELVAHAAFNAQRRKTLAPPAFCHLRELRLNRMGITDNALRGLLIAVRSSASTGVFSSLVVLNMAENLLTAQGCTLLVEAFVLKWSLPPSVLSDLALQGNAGMRPEDRDSIAVLKKVAEAAVQKRQEERQQQASSSAGWKRQEQQEQEAHSLPPLSIHLGALGAKKFTVTSSDTGEAFTASPEEKQQWYREEEKDNGEDGKRQEEQQQQANTFRQKKETEEEGECFPIFHLSRDRQAQQRSMPRPFTEIAVSESFYSSPICAPPSGKLPSSSCDVSSIHTRRTPQRFPPSALASPSFLQWSPNKNVWPQKHQRQAGGRRHHHHHHHHARTPLLSPAIETEHSAVREARQSMSPGMNQLSDAHTLSSVGAEPLVTVTEWENQGAATALTPHAQTSCGTIHVGALPQQQQQHLPRESSVPSASKPSSFSVGYDFGCLFASMDAKKASENSVWERNTSCHSSYDDYANGGGNGSYRGEKKAESPLHGMGHAATKGARNDTFLPLSLSPPPPPPAAAAAAYKDETSPGIEVEAIGNVLEANSAKSIKVIEAERECETKQLWSESPDKGEQLTLGCEKQDKSSGSAAAAESRCVIVVEPKMEHVTPKQEGMFQCANGIDVGHRPLRDSGENRETRVPHEETRPGRMRSFLITYVHPEGHVLCRGWRLLHRNDTTGEDARACLERDVWTLLQPPDVERWRVVVMMVVSVKMVFEAKTTTLLPPPPPPVPAAFGDNESRVGSGVLRLQITSNERRAVVGERLQQHLNAGDGTVALPRFTEALHRAEDDMVKIVRCLLDAAHGTTLPVAYKGLSAETLLHESHDNEESLVAELGAVLKAAVDDEAVGMQSVKWGDCISDPDDDSSSGDTAAVASARAIVAESPHDSFPSFVSTDAIDGHNLGEKPLSSEILPQRHALRSQRQPQEEEEEEVENIDDSSSYGSSSRKTDFPELIGAEQRTLSDAAPRAGGMVSHDAKSAEPNLTTAAILSAGDVSEEFVTGSSVCLADRMKTFVFSIPHREGHILCRGWRLLHLADAVGDEARRLVEADVLSFLQPSSECIHADDVGVARRVESVLFALEGSSSFTMRLHVITNERRAIVSDRLQRCAAAVNDEAMFPRFAGFLLRNKRYDIILAVEAYLGRTESSELHAHLSARYGTVKALVHYFHGDDAAMLREIMASGLTDVEIAVGSDAASTTTPVEGKEDEEVVARTSTKSEEMNAATLERVKPAEEEEEQEEEVSRGAGEDVQRQQQLPECMDVMHVRSSVEAACCSDTSCCSSSRASHSNAATSALPVHSIDDRRAVPVVVNKNGSTGDTSGPFSRAFAEKLSGLQFLAYSAMVHGAIVLDKKQRHKLRICKGRWGRQHVTIAVEWDAFLVVHFVVKRAFGVSSRKFLALVHPLVSGLQCSVMNEHAVGVHICVERHQSPDELGVSSTELQQKLHELISATSDTSTSSHGIRKLQHRPVNSSMAINNSNNLSSFSSLGSGESASGVMVTAFELLQSRILIDVTLSTASGAQKAVAAIEGARQRAASIMQDSIRVQGRQRADRPLPATPAT